MSTLHRKWRKLEALFSDEQVFASARWLIPATYSFIAFLAFLALAQWNGISSFPSDSGDLFWTVKWASFFSLSLSQLAGAVLLFLSASAIAGVLWHRFRFVRASVFLGIVQYQGLMITLVDNERHWYAPLFVSFFLIFLPRDIWQKRKETPETSRRMTLLLIWAAQGYLLLTYTFSGLFKVVTGIEQFFSGETSIFSPLSAALYVASMQTEFGFSSILGPTIVEYPLLGWAPLMVLLYVLTCSWWVAFTPALHRLWGLGLILFHLATVLSVGLLFLTNVLFLALFLANSPFSRRGMKFRTLVEELPIFASVLRLVRACWSRVGIA